MSKTKTIGTKVPKKRSAFAKMESIDSAEERGESKKVKAQEMKDMKEYKGMGGKVV